ncbi:hypothetical protein BGZ63DRAFT_403128 [Mariannaea sp. PMI_226]|nr:hypothetical protein BGZ63DRAFT_403128 [Mariannaea sp. PMI_226]
MVGVPGRSKGCNTCIQRKIKCDQETPLCGNCRKSNRLCTGYKRKLGYIWVGESSPSELIESGVQDATITHQGRWKRGMRPSTSALTVYHGNNPAPSLVGSLPLYLCRCLSLNPILREQFHYLFLHDHLPAEIRNNVQPSNSIITPNYLVLLQGSVIQSPALEAILAAFFAAHVGRKNNDMKLVHQSRSMYVKGLALLQKAIDNPRTRLSDETLAACRTLYLYELLECPRGSGRNAYISHQRGAMELLRLRGPEASSSPLGHSIFLGLRGQAIIEGLSAHTTSFLSDPEWFEGPWKFIPKSPIDKLQDLLFDLSSTFRQLQLISPGMQPHEVHHELRSIVANALEVETRFTTVYNDLQSSVSGPLYWPELSTIQSPVDDEVNLGKVFPISFQFPTFFIAKSCTTYWSSSMAVHFLLSKTYRKLALIESFLGPRSVNDTAAPTLSSSAHLSSEHNDKFRAMAKNICQSVEYLLAEDMGDVGPLNLLPQLRGCRNTLQESAGSASLSREIRWIDGFLEQIQNRFSFPINSVV